MFVVKTVSLNETVYHVGKTLSYNHLRRHKIKVKMEEKKRIMIECGNQMFYTHPHHQVTHNQWQICIQ